MKIKYNHARSILQSAYDWYLKKNQKMDPENRQSLEQQMLSLEDAINTGKGEIAMQKADQLEAFSKIHCKKSIFDYLRELIIALAIALIIAVVVRQVWFEPYEIPTGSMRPTFREQDHVTVTKTPFGLNIPLTTGHLLFDPNLVQRTSAVTFTSENIPNLDEDTTFLWVIPYKKRLIKRMIGKPGDSLYFYGGKIYGVDKDGNPINEYINSPWMDHLEHIPFMSFSGDQAPEGASEIFKQTNQTIGKLHYSPTRKLIGEINRNGEWVKDNPAAQKKPHDQPEAYSDFYGMGNFAMARLLTKDQLAELQDVDTKGLKEGVLYLELRHHPSLTYPEPLLLRDVRLRSILNPLRTIIPLDQQQLDTIMDNMYTARLVFKNGRAARYSETGTRITNESPRFDGIPDGTYEFYNGKLQNIGWGAIASDAEKSNPLYSHNPSNIQRLFNLGIEMYTAFEPHGPIQEYHPTRYAYFRDGDLYVLGAPLLKKDDPTLVEFNKREEKRQEASSDEKPYIAFKDNGVPLVNGKYDTDRIRAFGLKIPEGQYYMLGDNHAMSADSRRFGFVPEANLQGAPSLIVWPPGERWGFPKQKPYPFLNLPRLVVWTTAALALLLWWYLHRRYLRRPIKI